MYLGVADVGDVEGFGVGLLDVGADEVHSFGDVLGIFALLGSVAGADEGECGDAGVGDVGRILDVLALDTAAALAAGAPAAALAPAAVVLLLADQVGEAFLDLVAERLRLDRVGVVALGGGFFRGFGVLGPQAGIGEQDGQRRKQQSGGEFAGGAHRIVTSKESGRGRWIMTRVPSV